MKKIVCFFISVFLFIFAFNGFAKGLEVHFIDVKKGDSILIRTPNDKTILVDAGNLISGYAVTEYLKKQKIEVLDYLIFTHPHADHIGGAFFVKQMLKVRRVYDAGNDIKDLMKEQDLYLWYNELIRKDPAYKIIRQGDSLKIGEVDLQVLWPPQSLPEADFNTNSIVLMMKYKKVKVLLTADITREVESKLIKAYKLKSDLLKISHHGASDASSQEFLESVSPDIAVISVDHPSIRGYPTLDTIRRIEAVSDKVYKTYDDGDIVIYLDPETNN